MALLTFLKNQSIILISWRFSMNLANEGVVTIIGFYVYSVMNV